MFNVTGVLYVDNPDDHIIWHMLLKQNLTMKYGSAGTQGVDFSLP